MAPTRSTRSAARTRRTRGRALRQRVRNTLSTLARSKTTPRVVSGSPLRKSPATPWSASHATNVPPVEIIMAELPPPRKATTAKTPDGDKRKEHAEELCSRIEEVVNEYDIDGSDVALPKVMGLLLANQKLISSLLPKINKSHITQRLVNELFLGSMEIEHAAKYMLQKYLLEKCSYTSDERKKLLVDCTKSYKMLPLAANTGPSESMPSYENQLKADGTVEKRTSSLKRLETKLRKLGVEIGFPLESVAYDYSLINTEYEVQGVQNNKAIGLIEKLNHQRYLTGIAHGELADAKRVYKEKTDAFKKQYLRENMSLEFLPDEDDDCYEAYRAQLKKSNGYKAATRKLKQWKTMEGGRVAELKKIKGALDEKVTTFRELVLEWKEAKSTNSPKKRKSTDSKKKSPQGKKAKPPPPALSSSSDDSDDSDGSGSGGEESDGSPFAQERKRVKALIITNNKNFRLNILY